MNIKHTDSVEAVVAEFDEIWELTENLVSNGAIINKNDFKEAWRAKLREVFTTLQATQSQQEEEAVRKERERIIAIVQTSPQAFMVPETERRFIKAITPNHQD